MKINKRQNRWKVFLVAGLAGLLYMGLFSGCGGDKEETVPLPTTYLAGEEEITALAAPEGTAITLETTRQYIYDGLENANELVKAYMADLLAERIELEVSSEESKEENNSEESNSEENSGETESQEVSQAEDSSSDISSSEVDSGQEGVESSEAEKEEKETILLRYYFVNDSFEEVHTPNFKEETGSARLARATGKENELISIRAEWTATRCAITVGIAHGVITELPPEEHESVSAGALVSPMTELEAIDYLSNLQPSQLGLAGESMEEYEIYSMTGEVMVNDEPCMRLRVFSKNNPAGTNSAVGSYLMDSTGTLYQIDESTGEISKLLEKG